MDTLPDHDLDAVTDAADTFDFSDWLTGVEDLQEKNPQELWAGLGLNNEQIPGFNEVEDPRGEVNPWDQTKWAKFVKTEQALKFGPRWHQLVGITKMCELIIKGKPLLLMDQVGVGKTLQIVGAIVMYPMLRAYYQRNKRFPPQFKGLKCDTPDGNLPDRPHLIIVPVALFDQWMVEFKRYVKFGSVDIYPYTHQWNQLGRQTVWDDVFQLKDDKQTLSHKVLLVAYTVSSPALFITF
ncbi:hypothetical protein LXA43DRAFT_896537 [Ganoderma leucocontextum]|nr:hypothetical protein LXA43DRAFT_896537 [Ganoderma leucocontextum]